MTPELRQFIGQAPWCRASVQRVAEMLPEDDAELDSWIAEAIHNHDAVVFMLLVYAALSRDRPVHAHHLAGGTKLVVAPTYLPPIALRMQGDIAEYLLEGLKNTAMYHETEAAALLTVASWCDRHRGGVYPYDLLPMARSLARRVQGVKEVEAYLLSIALRANDETLLRLLKQHHPEISEQAWDKMVNERLRPAADNGPGSLPPVLDMVPVDPQYPLDPIPTIRRSVPRLGRNDPCHCGSGKKYKNCCYEKDRDRLQNSSGVTGHTLEEMNENPARQLTLERLNKMAPMTLARMDPREVPRPLLADYFVVLAFYSVDKDGAFLGKLGYADAVRGVWHWVMWNATRAGRKDIGDRLMKLREGSGFKEDQLRLSQRLLLLQDDPAKAVLLIEETARNLLKTDAVDELSDLAYSVAFSKFSALGILLYRGVLPFSDPRKAEVGYDQMRIIRQRLKLPEEDAVHKLIEANLIKAGEDADRALRETEEKFEAKRREVRELRESLDQIQKELARRERPSPASSAAPVPGATENEESVRELRQKLKFLEASIKERNEERNALQRRLEETQKDVEALHRRAQLAVGQQDGDAEPDHEDELLLSQEDEGNHPVRLIEFPRDFHERLNDFPHHVARAAMVMLGRLAGGDSAAFSGARRLKSRPNVVRQRIGIDFRLLFRLLPDRIQVIDLIPRQDFERRIKTLN